ncbi:MAG: hypothetical protein JSU72_20480 [Deltaproteobacteria bacterium]|nr:MAG: hypothetical protein JSU72_20480 [Deltaproteobacteria bacterium]
MIGHAVCNDSHLINPPFPTKANAMVYTDQAIACSSCGREYKSGFLVEIRDMGLYCSPCFRPAFVEYFYEHPSEEFLFIRGVWSLASRKRKTKRLIRKGTR